MKLLLAVALQLVANYSRSAFRIKERFSVLGRYDETSGALRNKLVRIVLKYLKYSIHIPMNKNVRQSAFLNPYTKLNTNFNINNAEHGAQPMARTAI